MSVSAHPIKDHWTPSCDKCDDLGWDLTNALGVRECSCRVQARIRRKLRRVPPEYEGICLEEIMPDLKRHPEQAFVWETVKNNPDSCYLVCGRSGSGKTTILQSLYTRAILLDRPAVAISLVKLAEDYRQAAKDKNGYELVLSPVSLETKRERWFVGLDDFHICRPTQFAGEMIFWLLDTVYSYRHQLVVTSQLDKNGLRRHWSKAGEGIGPAIMRRVLEIDGAIQLNMF